MRLPSGSGGLGSTELAAVAQRLDELRKEREEALKQEERWRLLLEAADAEAAQKKEAREILSGLPVDITKLPLRVQQAIQEEVRELEEQLNGIGQKKGATARELADHERRVGDIDRQAAAYIAGIRERYDDSTQRDAQLDRELQAAVKLVEDLKQAKIENADAVAAAAKKVAAFYMAKNFGRNPDGDGNAVVPRTQGGSLILPHIDPSPN